MPGMDPRAGDRVGPHVLESSLGSGGFADVWVGRDAHGRGVVIKLLRRDVAVDSVARARFTREVEVLAELDHPGIARLIAHDLAASPPYFVMERVVGQTLRERLTECSTMQRPIALTTVRAVMRGLTDAVAYAHASGVLHRDLKPANVLLDVDDAPRVLDFGMARLMGADTHAATTLGRIMGTRYYWAPEQAIGAEATPATDQFALATLAFELLTLRRAWVWSADGVLPMHLPVPPETNRPLSILERLRSGARPKPSAYRRELSPRVDAVLARAWATAPSERFADVRAFAAALAEALGGDGLEATRVGSLEARRLEAETRVLEPRVGGEARVPRAEEAGLAAMGTSVSTVLRPRSDERPALASRVVRWAPALLGAVGLGLALYALVPDAADDQPTVVVAGARAGVVEPEPIGAVTGTASADIGARGQPAVPQAPASPDDAHVSPRSAARAPRSTLTGSPPRAPAPSPVGGARAAALHARLDELAARPDLVRLAAFADQLDALAERIDSTDARARVRRLVATGSAVGDVARLRQALGELERAGVLGAE